MIEKHAKNLAAGLILANALCYLILALLLFFVVTVTIGESRATIDVIFVYYLLVLIPFIFFAAGIVSALLISDKSKKARIFSVAAEFVPMFLFPGYLVFSVLISPSANPWTLDLFLLFCILSVASYAIILFLFYGKKTKKLFA